MLGFGRKKFYSYLSILHEARYLAITEPSSGSAYVRACKIITKLSEDELKDVLISHSTFNRDFRDLGAKLTLGVDPHTGRPIDKKRTIERAKAFLRHQAHVDLYDEGEN